MYARQDYLTPGAAETVDLFARRARPDTRMRVLDIAPGKGEAASSLAERFGCRVTAIDLHDVFARATKARAAKRRMSELVEVVRGDGGRLPFRDGSFDAATCIGGPSIVGEVECLAELARVVRPRGAIVVSDLAWRIGDEVELGPEWGWLADSPRPSVADWTGLIERTELRLEETVVLGMDAWDAYHDPMLQVAEEARRAGDREFADEMVAGILPERRAAEQGIFEYVVFVMSTRAG